MLSGLPTRPLGDQLAGRIQPGPGDRVLWLHGYTLDSSSWAELWSLLPNWYHIGVDLPGHGASAEIAPGSTLVDLGKRLGEVCEEHGIRHVVALSFGTLAGLQLLIEYPEMLASAVFGAPAIAGGPTEPSMAKAYARMTLLARMRVPRSQINKVWLSSRAWRGMDKRPDLHKALGTLVESYEWAELRDATKTSQFTQPHQTPEAMKTIRSSMLVLVGQEEMAAHQRCAELIEEHVPKCHRIVLPHTDHLCMLETPSQSAPMIDEHLSKHSQSR